MQGRLKVIEMKLRQELSSYSTAVKQKVRVSTQKRRLDEGLILHTIRRERFCWTIKLLLHYYYNDLHIKESEKRSTMISFLK
jgi:hypothetical protein